MPPRVERHFPYRTRTIQGHLTRRTSPARLLASVGAVLLLSTFAGTEASGQRADRWPAPDLPAVVVPALPTPTSVLAGTPTTEAHLSLDVRREAWLLGMGTRLALVAEIFPEPTRTVSGDELDPRDIGWSADRNVIGNDDPGASRASDRTRAASLLLPVVVSVATARSGRRWRDVAVAGAVYSEALFISKTLSHLGKIVLGRPRPGAYRPRSVAGDRIVQEPVGSGTFHSMPSSHASTAWTGASVAVTSHLLLRPGARGLERFGVGFVGGALAGVTSALRVSSGAHFPSDVIAGAGIGIASGVLVPLVHVEDRPLPSGRAVLQSMSGVAVGTLLGVLLGG